MDPDEAGRRKLEQWRLDLGRPVLLRAHHRNGDDGRDNVDTVEQKGGKTNKQTKLN